MSRRQKIRTRFVRFRADPEQESRWRAAAATHGLTFSEWVRGLADNATATGSDGRELAAALAAIRLDLARGAGNNLNQLAHVANTAGTISADALAEASAEITGIRRRVETALRAVRPPRPRAVP